MFKHILVAYDGSDIAQKALETACDLAKHYQAKVTVLHVNVIATNLRAQAMNSPALAAMLNEEGDRVSEKAENYLSGSGLNTEVKVVKAPSAPKPIIDAIKNSDVDLVVMGSRGLGAVKQYFGSVSHAVLNLIEVPAMVIKG
ncbi:MAG: universal stress protein [Eggerthellaceae bacterium]|jgi:nucleotide-binding universal stress UspA family protein